MNPSRTLYEKLWDEHIVRKGTDGTDLIYIDRQLLHEVTSPQAFDGLSLAGRKVWRIDANLAVPDHNVPTIERTVIRDSLSRLQLETLDANCQLFDIPEIPLSDCRQGIVHVVGPEQGATLPGMTVVCGDSHTSTHGALACLAFGIGTSEVEHALATQTLMLRKAKNMRVCFDGEMPSGVFAKDLALALIGYIGTAGATGHAIEFCGPVVRALSMESRMTLCNMAIEAGARSGLVAVDEVTLEYVHGRPLAPIGAEWDQACDFWRTLQSDADAQFDAEISINVSQLAPQVTWGTSPEMVAGIDGRVPDPASEVDAAKSSAMQRALDYMSLQAGMAIADINIDKVFIGSCTNSRIEDLRAAAAALRGRTRTKNVRQVLVVPGSGLVKRQAEAEGLDKLFVQAGFDWREPGCSMCLGMNEDRLAAGERCASTSNRNFEGRQGAGGRTHLLSPAMAVEAAVTGKLSDCRRHTDGPKQ
jgi:3-isopropylmalate/(R)-2-methylmalate dehydratase large subunit